MIDDDLKELIGMLRPQVQAIIAGKETFGDLCANGMEALAALEDDDELSDKEKRNIVADATQQFIAALLTDDEDEDGG